jgi:hypothetical protein
MKASFALLLSILIIALFSLVLIQISFTKTLHSSNQTNAYVYTQALFHSNFFKDLILDMENLECQTHLVLNHPTFDIQATFEYVQTQNNCTNTHAIVDLVVKSKHNDFSVVLHERFVKKF